MCECEKKKKSGPADVSKFGGTKTNTNFVNPFNLTSIMNTKLSLYRDLLFFPSILISYCFLSLCLYSVCHQWRIINTHLVKTSEISIPFRIVGNL